MGNSSGCCCSCPVCTRQPEREQEREPEPEPEPESERPVYTSLYDYPCRTFRDLTVRRGDVLEVIAETEHWLYVRKRRVEGHVVEERGDEAGASSTGQGYVPREFVKRLHSLQAQSWFSEAITKRLEAKRCLLRPENSEGAFLVWMSQEHQHYFLSVKTGTVARHYRIQEGDGTFFLVPRKQFRSLRELVESYSADPDGLCATLDQACVWLDSPTVPTLSYEEQWEVDRTTLQWVDRLGSGEFGEVWSGLWNNTTHVAIKEIKVLGEDFLREFQIMKELRHCRLLRLYGVVTKEQPVCIITELVRNGSLSKFLTEHRDRRDIPFSLMMDFAVQVTEGMDYLESRQIVHRDLRADNILLTEMQSCKIADFGLAHFTFTGEQRVHTEVKLPVKWMAPEIFSGEPYTCKSDVWSFGVLLTEIMNYGEEPYAGRDKMWCVNAVQRGHRMSRPPSCPEGLYDIMLLCWRPHPSERPAFSQLTDMLTALAPECTTALE